MCDDLSVNIENFINNDFSICREERQYALYLSNVLRYYGSQEYKKALDKNPNLTKPIDIFAQCGLDFEQIIIENVFYEATFMRDFFDANRRKFLNEQEKIDNSTNWCWKTDCLNEIIVSDKNSYSISFNFLLLAYCWEKCLKRNKNDFNEIIINLIKKRNFKEKNYGARNEIPLLSNLTEEKDFYKVIVRAMMNAKPDLAVIYKDDNQKKLLFIECKYNSGEDFYNVYKGKDVVYRIRQTVVQGYIADFLCNYSPYFTGFEVSKEMEKAAKEISTDAPFAAKKVTFVSQNLVMDKNMIKISDLINLEKEIFIIDRV